MTNPQHEANVVKQGVATMYTSWHHQNAAAVNDLVTEDVLILGPGDDDVLVGRRSLDKAVTNRSGLPRKTLEPEQVHVGLAAGERSGWFWAFPATSSSESGSHSDVAERLSGVVSKQDDGRWLIIHAYLSHALPNEQIEVYQQQIRTLAPVGDEVRTDAAQLVDLLQRNLGVGRLDLVARRDDAVVIGSDPDEVFDTKSYLDTFEPMLEQFRELESNSRFDFPGGIRARLTDDGQTGFVATNITATLNGNQLPTFRVSWAFTQIAGAFRLVCDHHGFSSSDKALMDAH